MKAEEYSAVYLRDLLFKELEDFREGKSSPKRSQIVINFVREIINVSKLEIVHAAISANKDKRDVPRLNLKM